MRRLGKSVSAALSVVILFGACGSEPGTTTAPQEEQPEPERVVKLSPSFAADIVEIFNRRGCTASTCHGGGPGRGAGGMALSDTATAYASLVNVLSGCNGLVRVIPRDAANSYLLEKLQANETTTNLRIAIASDRPTRALVAAALRWGAYTVLFQPWDASEISERLLS